MALLLDEAGASTGRPEWVTRNTRSRSCQGKRSTGSAVRGVGARGGRIRYRCEASRWVAVRLANGFGYPAAARHRYWSTGSTVGYSGSPACHVVTAGYENSLEPGTNEVVPALAPARVATAGSTKPNRTSDAVAAPTVTNNR